MHFLNTATINRQPEKVMLASRKYKPSLYISAEIAAETFDHSTYRNCFRGIISAGAAKDLAFGTKIVLKKLID